MKHFKAFTAASLLAAVLPTASNASIVVTIDDVGSDIVASYSGSLEYEGLFYRGGDINLDVAKLSGTTARLGMPFTNLGFSGFSGPASWGSEAYAVSTVSAIGDFFVLDIATYGSPRIYLPKNYISGRSLSGSATFADVTLASLGLIAGQYVYTAGSQTITVNIGGSGDASAVPEPASWALMIAGFGVVGFLARRKQQVSVRVRFA